MSGVEFSDEMILEIKRKRELADLDDHYVREKIERILQQNKKMRTKAANANSFKEFARSKEFAELKKLVRAELRAVYGVFDLDEKKRRKELLLKLRDNKDTGDNKINDGLIRELLVLHQSSKERIDHYDAIYKKIFSITGRPKSVLDLGCGANPYSYPYLGCAPVYVAMDLPSDDLKDLVAFFRMEGIDGEAMAVDLVKDYGKLGSLLGENPVDVIFLFKVLDSLEAVKRNISGKIIDALRARWIVVSFPLVSIGGGKAIRNERRAWFEKLLARKGLAYETFSVVNETFYVIRDARSLSERKSDKEGAFPHRHE